MRNSVFLSRRAEKFLASLRDAKLYRRLRIAIDHLEQDARPSGCLKLAGEPDLYRIRVGDYRIIYKAKSCRLYRSQRTNSESFRSQPRYNIGASRRSHPARFGGSNIWDLRASDG